MSVINQNRFACEGKHAVYFLTIVLNNSVES